MPGGLPLSESSFCPAGILIIVVILNSAHGLLGLEAAALWLPGSQPHTAEGRWTVAYCGSLPRGGAQGVGCGLVGPHEMCAYWLVCVRCMLRVVDWLVCM